MEENKERTPDDWTDEELIEHLEWMWENRELPVTEVHGDGTMTITHGGKSLHITIPPETNEKLEIQYMTWKNVNIVCKKLKAGDIIAYSNDPTVQFLVKKCSLPVPKGPDGIMVWICLLKPIGHDQEAKVEANYIKIGSILSEESHEYGTIKFE